MRLPWGRFSLIRERCLNLRHFALLGCLSFEDRCCVVPFKMKASPLCKHQTLIEVRDPADAFPDYRASAAERILANKNALFKEGVRFNSPKMDLLATEDELLASLNQILAYETVVLDITSFPKRYFCFYLKNLLRSRIVRNVVAVYTAAGKGGYYKGNLAEDPMTCDHLPGFSSSFDTDGNGLVISLGFEPLSIDSILDVFRDNRKDTRIILPFPPNGNAVRRAWGSLRHMISGDLSSINSSNIEIISALDAEQVYNVLLMWKQNQIGLTLAPFGPKPHSLGMAIFAINYDIGMYYTQPKSYNPMYTVGSGDTTAYVVKWNGIECFNRQQTLV